jgi:VWFA-related protein
LKHSFCAIALTAILVAMPLSPQTNQPAATAPEATLHITSRAVLVDVLVTDRNGAPVRGLKQSAFTVDEQGKPQTISFFEEHTGTPGPPKEIPKLPPNVFSNFSPYPDPPVVNVLLLDSLNTRMESQQVVHKQALKFLKSAKPGTRMAIFTMGLGLHFVQGFTDDPSLLLAALNDKKNNEVQSSVMIQSQSEVNANANLAGMIGAPVSGGGTAGNPAMAAALSSFLDENEGSRETDRVLLTLQNMQRLATFLTGFPGRKNVIWFSESFPLVTQGNIDPQRSQIFANTMAMLAAARVAIYPVDSRGVDTASFYQADNQLPSSTSAPYQIMGVDSSPTSGKITQSSPGGGGGPNAPGSQVGGLQQQDSARALAQYTEESVAKETGGKAFVETNGFSKVIDDITSSSADFYTLSYAPTDQKMDGSYRKIDVKVAGGHFNLSFRRGYPATDAALPGSALLTRAKEIQNLAAQNPGAVDPLIPFMDLGMPQSEQILFKVAVKPLPQKPSDASQASPPATAALAPPTDSTPTTNPEPKKALPFRYKVDFAIDLSDLTFDQDADGQHKGALSLSILAYDRYGNIVARKETQASLGIKPEVWDIYKKTGLLFSTQIDVPKGQYWLRIGLYDQSSAKVGTLEIPLDSVTTVAQK